MRKFVYCLLSIVYSSFCFAQKPFKLTDSIIDGNCLRTHSIYFDLSKATLKPKSFSFLDSLAAFLNKNQNIVVQVGRFGDVTLSGSRLGYERAKTIVNYLIEKGIYPQRVIAMSYGETEPINSDQIIAAAKTKEEKEKLEQENIRTEIRIIRSDYVSKGANIVLRGMYQGKNIYVQNPFASNGIGFCVTKVIVNGTELDSIKFPKFKMYSNAFEIPINDMGIKIGDTLYIQIFHKDDCKPKVIGPELTCGRRSGFDMIKIEASPEGILKWKTKNEIGKGPYVIEQFRWNKWIMVGEVGAKGRADTNTYQFKLYPHSGENQVRIKQFDSSLSYLEYIKPYKFVSNVKEVMPYVTTFADGIDFTDETLYEIYDREGNLLRKGFGKTIDCSNLPGKKKYWVNYDNKTEEFKKK